MNSENKTPQEELLDEVKELETSQEETASETVTEKTEADKKENDKKSKKANKASDKKGLKAALSSRKFKRGGMATVFTAVFIVAIILVNVVVSMLSDRFPSMNIDLTANKVNTLSEEALDAAKKVTYETNIYIMGSDDWLNYMAEQSVYNFSSLMSLTDKLEEANSKIKAQNIDLETNPTFASKYADENLTNGYVVVETEKRYRVLTTNDLFPVEQNSQTYETSYYNNVDSALATALQQTNLEEVPVVAIATGHNEVLSGDYLTSISSFFKDNAFDVVEFNILTEEIPENTQLLFLPTPNTDYTEDELKKMDDFLSNKESDKTRSILLTATPGQNALPNLSAFLAEWGISYDPTSVVMESDSSRTFGNPLLYISDASTENKISESNSYDLLVTPGSVALELLFTANNSVVTYPLATTADTCYLQKTDSEEDASETAEKKAYNTAVMARKQLDDTGDAYANVFVLGSTQMILPTYVNTSTFSNGTYFTDLIRYATNTTDSDNTVYSERVQTGARDMTATTSVVNFIGLGIFTITIPIVVLLVGLVIYFKRRHL